MTVHQAVTRCWTGHSEHSHIWTVAFPFDPLSTGVWVLPEPPGGPASLPLTAWLWLRKVDLILPGQFDSSCHKDQRPCDPATPLQEFVL